MLCHPGYGGQMACADPERGIGWAYFANHLSIYNMGDDPLYLELKSAMYQALDSVEKTT